MRQQLEAGVVYTRVGRRGYWLALDRKRALRIVKGVERYARFTPGAAYVEARGLAIEWLAEDWGLTIEELDVALARHFSPPAKNPHKARRVGCGEATTSRPKLKNPPEAYWRTDRLAPARELSAKLPRTAL